MGQGEITIGTVKVSRSYTLVESRNGGFVPYYNAGPGSESYGDCFSPLSILARIPAFAE